MDRVIKAVSITLAKKKTLFLGVLFFALFVLLLPYPAYAILGIFGGIADGIAKAIAGVFISLALAIFIAILGIASLILGWSIDPLFIRVGYTSGGVIDIGWPVTRDLANMGIVLALVFIGLGTALRIKEYQAQKTLPILIGVALLINFTPVILGVIVDASNIVMNFFLEGLTGGQIIVTVFSNISTMIMNDISFFNPAESIGTLASVAMIGIFMFFAAILFFLFALLFIIRRIAIWILVILAPIAFVAYILPGTRGFARMWWNQFIQWTIIGVFAAFFLWLGNHMIGLAAQGGLTGAVAPGGGGIIGNTVAAYLNSVLPYGIALIFLLIGFFAALSTSAMGASGIVAGAQKIPGKVGGWTRAKAGAWGRSRWEESERAKGIRKFATERVATARTPEPTWGKGQKTIGGWFKRRGAWGTRVAATPIWAGGRAAGRTVGPGFMEAQRKEAAEAEKKAQAMEVPAAVAQYWAASTDAERIGILNRLVKDPFDFDEATDPKRTKNPIPEEEVFKTMLKAEEYKLHKDIRGAVPTLLAERTLADALTDEEFRTNAGFPPTGPLTQTQQRDLLVKAYGEKILGITKPERMGYLSSFVFKRTGVSHPSGTERFENTEFTEAMVKHSTGDRIGNFLKWRQQAGAQVIEDRVRQLAQEENQTGYAADPKQTIKEWFHKHNSRLWTYIQRSGGRGYFSDDFKE